MKQLIKQSIIGALYMFMIAAMGAVVVVALYTMAGRQYGDGGQYGRAAAGIYTAQVPNIAPRAPSSIRAGIYGEKDLAVKLYRLQVQPIDKYILIYDSIRSPPMRSTFPYREFFTEIRKSNPKVFKRNLAIARYIRIFMS